MMRDMIRRIRLTLAKRMRIMRCMKFEDILKSLEAHKGDGTWQRVADGAHIHYDTIARIARRKLVPNAQAAERIADVLEQIAAEKARTAA